MSVERGWGVTLTRVEFGQTRCRKSIETQSSGQTMTEEIVLEKQEGRGGGREA